MAGRVGRINVKTVFPSPQGTYDGANKQEPMLAPGDWGQCWSGGQNPLLVKRYA